MAGPGLGGRQSPGDRPVRCPDGSAVTGLRGNPEKAKWSLGLWDPAIYTDGTIFTIDYACKDRCAGASDGVEGAWVVGLDPSTGTAKFRVPITNSVETKTVNDLAFCAPGGSPTDTAARHAWPSSFRIAGDGLAYLSYTTTDIATSVQRSAC